MMDALQPAIQNERSDKLRIRRNNILITNDDGESPGLRMLIEAAKGFGNVFTIIPNKQRSAVSGAITLHKPIRLSHLGPGFHAINGTPADCVLFALYSGHFPKPDMVLSGVNWGDNTGLGSVFGSGTIGACWQAVLEDTPAIAFSMVKGGESMHDLASWGERETAVEEIERMIRSLLPRLSKDTFFNVNFPREIKGARIVETNSLQKERYFTEITRRLDPNDSPYYWLSGKAKKIEKGTDAYELLESGCITVSELSLKFFSK